MLMVGCGSSAPATIIDLTGNVNYTSKNFDTPPNGWKFTHDYSCKWDSGVNGISINVGDGPIRMPIPTRLCSSSP
jgi:hypothetical protein